MAYILLNSVKTIIMKFNKNILYLFVFSVILIISCNNIEDKKQEIIIEHKTEKPKLVKTFAVEEIISNDTIKEENIDNNIYIETIDCGDDFIDTTIDCFLYSEISTKPVFRDGFEDIKAYIQDNIEYPQTAKNDSVAGTVYIAFVIGILGKVENVMLIRGVREDLNSVCVSVIEKMPNWIPGKAENKPVRVQMFIPIRFVLDSKNETSGFVIYPDNDLNFEDTKTDFDLNIYPNPVISYFNIEVSELSDDMGIAIFDMQGKMILQRKINEKTTRIETENFGKGSFVIKLFSKALDINISKKVIINK